MTYNPAIPQATDRFRDSQPEFLNNFTLLNTYFGIDHFTFDALSNNGKHKQVTLPDRTLTPPAPGASECALFAKTTGGVTTPFLLRDGLAAPEYAILPIRAFGAFTGAGVIVSAQNCTSSAFAPGTGFTITLPANVVSGTSYGVLITAGVNALNPQFSGFYSIVNATTFNVGFRNNSGTFLAPDFFTIAVIQA